MGSLHVCRQLLGGTVLATKEPDRPSVGSAMRFDIDYYCGLLFGCMLSNFRKADRNCRRRAQDGRL